MRKLRIRRIKIKNRLRGIRYITFIPRSLFLILILNSQFSKNFSASIAAIHPVAAAVIA